MRSRERGFLLIVAVVLIVLGAVMALAISLMVGGGTLSGADQLNSAQALYAAEAGLERAFYGQSKGDACNTLYSSTVAVGTGGYSTSATLYPVSGSTTLAAGISATDTVIPLTANTGYAPFGRIQIESEKINYGGIGTSAAQCSPFSPPCLTGAERGADASFATSHASGKTVAQDICLVTSDGTVGSDAHRQLQGTRLRANLLPPSANANFNQCTNNANPCVAPDHPTGWNLSTDAIPSYQPWQDTCGPDGSRCAYAQQLIKGNSTSVDTPGNFTFTPPITVTAPVTMSLTFDYNAICYPGDNCNTNKELSLAFSLSNGVTTWNSATFNSPITNGWQTATTTIAITGSGTISLTTISFTLTLKSGSRKYGYLDNLSLDNSATPNYRLLLWRENFP